MIIRIAKQIFYLQTQLKSTIIFIIYLSNLNDFFIMSSASCWMSNVTLWHQSAVSLVCFITKLLVPLSIQSKSNTDSQKILVRKIETAEAFIKIIWIFSCCLWHVNLNFNTSHDFWKYQLNDRREIIHMIIKLHLLKNLY